jgi:hypothetical protein
MRRREPHNRRIRRDPPSLGALRQQNLLAAQPATTSKANGNGANLSFAAQLFLAMDKLCKNLEPFDYKPVALGLMGDRYSDDAIASPIKPVKAVPPVGLCARLEITPGRMSIATMHLAKGLEFCAVAVMACDDEIIPSQERIENVADDADLEEVYETERHLLYGLLPCPRPSARDRRQSSVGVPGRPQRPNERLRVLEMRGDDPRNSAKFLGHLQYCFRWCPVADEPDIEIKGRDDS